MDKDDIKRRFCSPPVHVDEATITYLHDIFGNFAQVVDNIIPDGRQKSLVMTHMEDALHWAVDAVEKK